MLTSPTGLLRKACLQTNSHPLQYKALELCFNISLNRLSTSHSSPIILNTNPSHRPSLSNALVAAFKRALAQQRRGSIDNQQQPVLAQKVKVEQLLISILDDPSVSRIMREAGFSSTQIKNSIERNVSSGIFSQRPAVTSCLSNENNKPILQDIQLSSSNGSKLTPTVRTEDVMSVIDTMMDTNRKNVVVIRECLVSAYDIVRGVIEKLESGNNIVLPSNLRFIQFVSLPLHSLSHLSKEEVDDKVKELNYLVKSCLDRGVILYLGDIKWASDYWSEYSQKNSPMQHMIMELSRLMFGVWESGKLWLMGIANSETYMSCKTGHPSLETLWHLFAHTTPVGGLDLTLNLDSKDSRDEKKQLACCGESSINFTRDLSCFSFKTSISTIDGQKLIRNKRQRDEHGQSYIERFADAIQENPSRVFFMEDVDQVDYESQMGIKEGIKSGKISLTSGTYVHLKDAIIVLTCESFKSDSRPYACSPMRRSHNDSKSAMLDLNVDAKDTGILNSVDTQVIFKV